MSDQPPILPNIRVPTHALDEVTTPALPVALEDRDNFIRNLGTILTGGGGSAIKLGNAAPPVVPPASASGKAAVLTLPQIKLHCKIELDQTDEDDHLLLMEMAARIYTESYLRYAIDTAVGENVKMALLILIADWYRNRELMREGSWVDAPIAYKALLSVERDYPTYT